MNEYKGRVESYSRECLRKESQIKELQGRIETGDGCKYHHTPYSFSQYSVPTSGHSCHSRVTVHCRSLPCLPRQISSILTLHLTLCPGHVTMCVTTLILSWWYSPLVRYGHHMVPSPS